jgi:flagellar hook assembly protein FlgD
MALAPGDGAAMAFDGSLLSHPKAKEQPVAEAVSVTYAGVFVPLLQYPVISPNGDGTAEAQTLSYRIVRPSTVHATLSGPNGTTIVLDDGAREPGTYTFPFTGLDETGAPLPEGTWKLAVAATDDRGVPSSADRTFTLDKTLGPLRLDTTVVRVGKTGGTLTVSTDLTRAAQLTLQIETPTGVVVAAAKAQAPAGAASIRWDGRTVDGQPARAGGYVAHLFAKSAVGTSDLRVAFTVRRVAGK